MAQSGLAELNGVVAVAQHRNFRAAAAELGISPSALSHAVGSLEQRLGLRLFNRTTRSVSLTEAGEQFLARVRPALREIAEAMESVNGNPGTPVGTLRLALSESAARQIFVPVVLEFLKRYPDMQVDLVTENRLADIVEEGFDAGVRLGEAVPRDMVAVPCGPDQRFAVVGSPGYFRRRLPPASPGDLAAHDCIRRRQSGGAIARWEFARRGDELIVDVNGSLVLDSEALVVEAALYGAGLACVNEWSVAADIAAGRLIRVLEEWTPPFPGLRLYYPAHRHVSAGLRAFIAVVRDVGLPLNQPARPLVPAHQR
jgi:DNA-binding transcriptional LysR family regulator